MPQNTQLITRTSKQKSSFTRSLSAHLIMGLTISLGALGMSAHVLADTPSSMPDLSKPLNNNATKTTRIYSEQQVTLGKRTFETHCQTCHGLEGVGEVKEWQKSRADGTFPAPPLNGTAHTWHHNLKVLLGTINRGGIPLGGRMPSFKTVLSDNEKFAVLAYVQSLWPDEIYEVWLANNSKQ